MTSRGDERQDAKNAKLREKRKNDFSLLSYLGVLGVFAFTILN
jgi:hypothetical protein